VYSTAISSWAVKTFRSRNFLAKSLVLLSSLLFCWLALFSVADDEEEPPPDNSHGIQLDVDQEVGHPTFSSPHVDPIVINDGLIYVTNTPADTVDVIDSSTSEVVFRINVGIDPVGLAVRPDGSEIWVSNHISDTISVIDIDSESDFYHQVIATIQDVDKDTLQTNFDEPTGIGFASDSKAYVALGPANQVAIIDVEERAVTGHLDIAAQDPRALTTRGPYLYVLAFESGNTSQISGCNPQDIDGDVCTYDAVEHTHTNNNVLSLGIDVDIVKNPKVPDRDLFIFNTNTDRLIDVVEGTGTLLYGLDVTSKGTIYIAQADARNVENGRAGTQRDELVDMENRAFLNQITGVNCRVVPCRDPDFLELEPEPGLALATPYAIKVSDDDRTIVATAAGSNKVFTVDIETGQILGRVDVDAVPRGIALENDAEGAPEKAWVLNVVANTVSQIDLSTLESPTVSNEIVLNDPTPPLMKQGRIAFNNANASSTGTFSCESCHPDNNVDQLVWVLDTPSCNVPERCTQIPPRLTMPVRGLRDTQPYHWDGIPGDPYGGVNVQSLWEPEDPNCDMDQPESCTRDLVNGSLGTTMCDVTDCPVNDEGKAGLLDAETRDALAHYILNVPYPPAPHRPFNNEMSASAKTGLYEFNYLNDSGTDTGAQACGACHKAPFLTSTNTPSSTNLEANSGSFNGMDAPTWRGAYDRWIITPQARFNVIDLLERIDRTLLDGSFPEQTMWFHAGARTQANWDMVLEYSTGFSGSYARQVTLNETSAREDITDKILEALEGSASSRGVILQAEGLLIGDEENTAVALEYRNGGYADRISEDVSYTRDQLIGMAEDGTLLLTITARTGKNVEADTPQPVLWPYWTIGNRTWEGIEEQSPKVEIPFLTEASELQFKGRHIREDSQVYLNGHPIDGTIECEEGALPDCVDEKVLITFTEAPARFGLNFVQVQTRDGLFSNDAMFYSERVEKPDVPGNLIVSGGSFERFEFPLQRFWNTVENDGNDVDHPAGIIRVRINTVNTESPWRAQISHTVPVVANQEYTLCYRARSDRERFFESYLDANMHQWQNLGSGRLRASVTRAWQNFQHTFTASQTDITARIAFDFAQSAATVYIDDIGLYEGSECGDPEDTNDVGFLSTAPVDLDDGDDG